MPICLVSSDHCAVHYDARQSLYTTKYCTVRTNALANIKMVRHMHDDRVALVGLDERTGILPVHGVHESGVSVGRWISASLETASHTSANGSAGGGHVSESINPGHKCSLLEVPPVFARGLIN